MLKNVAGQKIALYAYDTSTGLPKTGDAANVSAYLSKDYGAVAQLTDTSATELDATNAKGWYIWDVSQGETNANALLFSGKSSTANITVVGLLIYTRPPNFSAASIDSDGRVDIAKIVGTPQSAGDVCGRLTIARAGYLDNLAGGSVALESTVQQILTFTTDFYAMTDRPGDTLVFTADAMVNAISPASMTAMLATEADGPHLPNTVGAYLSDAGIAGNRLLTAIELNSGSYRFTTAALALAPTNSAASIRSAVGLAAANLDTQFSSLAAYVDTEVAAVKVTTDRLATAIEADGGVWRFTTNALEQAPTGGAGVSPARVEVVGPVLNVRNLRIVRTGDYLTANGLAVVVEFEGLTVDLSEQTHKLKWVTFPDRTEYGEVEASTVDYDAGILTLTYHLTHAATALAAGLYHTQFDALHGDDLTIYGQGRMEVLEAVTAPD